MRNRSRPKKSMIIVLVINGTNPHQTQHSHLYMPSFILFNPATSFGESRVEGWNKPERLKVRVLCFVWIGTVDDRFTQRDDDAQNYLVPRTENKPMRMNAFQVNTRRK